MRFAPDGHALAYTLGYGGGGLSIQVVTVGASGAVLAVFPAGHDPRWITSRHLIARSPDGLPSSTTVAGYVCEYVGANQGDLDAAGSRVAYAADRAQGVRVYAAGVSVQAFGSTFEPGLSPGGTLAVRDVATGAIRLERLVGCQDVPARDPVIGPATRPRWSSQSLVVDTVPYGAVQGRSTPDQPSVDLSVPGRATTHPVVLWTGARLFVGVVLDDGELVVADWGSLLAREARGWPVATSGGSAFDWDLAVAPWSASVVLVAYLTPGGTLALVEVNTATAPVDVSRPVTPEPPIPPEPPEPETPEPPDPGPDPPEPGPEPEPPPTQEGIVIEFAELRNMEMRLEDTYKNHGGHPPVSYTIHVNQEGFVWRQHYWDRRKAGMDHETAIRSIESDIDTIEGRPDRWAAPPIQPAQPGTIRGPLGTDGRHFTVP